MASGPTIPPPGPESLQQRASPATSTLLGGGGRSRRQTRRSRSGWRARSPSSLEAWRFVHAPALIYGLWIAANLGWLGFVPWDPTFVVLAMIASVEAIILSTFILITQN